MTHPSLWKPIDDAVASVGFGEAETILAAVSGGPDSIALAEALRRISTGHAGWKVHIAHVNHGLRGNEADEDEQFVSAYASARGLPYHAIRVDARRVAQEEHLSPEEAARKVRYSALRTVQRSIDAGCIALGHTLDDQAETVLLRLLRGTGLDGLASMKTRDGDLVRPFLGVRRQILVDWLDDEGISFRRDSSNDDLRLARNRIRREIMPALTRLQPGTSRALSRLADQAGRERELMDEEMLRLMPLLGVSSTARGVTLRRSAWRSLHPALRARALRCAIAMSTPMDNVDAAHIDRMSEHILASVDQARVSQFPHDLTLVVSSNTFYIGRAPDLPVGLQPMTLQVPGSAISADGQVLARRVQSMGEEDMHALLTVCGPDHLLGDARRLGSQLHVRSVRAGDRMQPLGLQGSRKLQDMLVDARILRADRIRVPIVENDHHIVWAVGIAIDQRVAITDTTDSVMHLTYRQPAAE